jgi:glutaredoxin
MRLRVWRSIITLVGLCALSVGSSTAGEIYKWIDEHGRVQFSDKAPDKEQVETITIKPIANSIKSPRVSVSDFLQNAQLTRNQVLKDKASRDRPVVMYSAVWCGVCKTARQYFQANNIPFSEYDVEKSERGRNDYARLKGRGVPIILVGKKRMDGFSPARFKNMYPH